MKLAKFEWFTFEERAVGNARLLGLHFDLDGHSNHRHVACRRRAHLINKK